MALKRIIFVRPGETDWNLAGRLQGWVAAPLNAHGREQIKRLANFVRHIGLTKLVSSDIQRAKETAEILAEVLGFEPTLDMRLRERHIGHWQGLTVPEIRGWYPEEYAAVTEDQESYVITDGESFGQLRARLREALQDIIAEADTNTEDVAVGIISHTTAIRVLIPELISDADLDDVNFGNSSVTSLMRTEDGSWQLVAVNDGLHLEGLISRYMPEIEDEA